LRYVDWTWDPDPSDDTCPRARWLEWLREAGFPGQSSLDKWQRGVLIGIKE